MVTCSVDSEEFGTISNLLMEAPAPTVASPRHSSPWVPLCLYWLSNHETVGGVSAAHGVGIIIDVSLDTVYRLAVAEDQHLRVKLLLCEPQQRHSQFFPCRPKASQLGVASSGRRARYN